MTHKLLFTHFLYLEMNITIKTLIYFQEIDDDSLETNVITININLQPNYLHTYHARLLFYYNNNIMSFLEPFFHALSIQSVINNCSCIIFIFEEEGRKPIES